MDRVDEGAFTPQFLAQCSYIDLVALQHDLRQHPEDKAHLYQVLEELRKRQVDLAPLTGEPTK